MAHSMPVYVPSTDAVLTSLRMATQTEEEIVNEYLSYPKLPYGKAIKIDKISLLNFNPLSGECQGKIRYLTFRQRCPEEFPKGENPMEDYMDEEQVAPVIFVCGDTKYRVKMELWYPLGDVVKAIQKKQGRTGRKCLPVEVFIDQNDQFMVKLFNLCADHRD